MLSYNKRHALALVAALCATVAVTACSSDDDKGSQNTSSGTSGASGGMTSGGMSSGGATKTLYERLGMKAGIAAAVHEVAIDAVKDPNIASYFFAQTAATTPAGHPTLVQLEECFTLQLANAAGGPEQYPGTVSGGFVCRSMTASHANLGIPAGEFDKFVTSAAGTLKRLGVADDDIAVIGGVLNGTKAQVAQDTTRQTGPFQGDAGL